MNKKKAKISLVVLALVTVLFAYTVIIGIGKTEITGAMRNIILGLDAFRWCEHYLSGCRR